jgi:universal stress protein E
MRILAATDFSTRSQRALRRAGLLARDTGAELTLVHVVDDDQPQDLIAMERREAGRILAEQVGAVAEFRGVQCHPMVATGDPFDAILRTAADLNADLIVMGAHRKQFLRDVFVGTTIERVIRSGPYPVLMVNNEVQGDPYRTVLAPVDMSEPSANAIRVAQTLGLIDDARVTLIHAFHPFAKAKMTMTGLDQASIDEYVASQRQTARDELSGFLVATGFGGTGWSRRIEEGRAFEVISHAVNETRPDLLVIGTHGRSGLMKLLLGSVTEEILRSLNVDILVVPPVRDSDYADASRV